MDLYEGIALELGQHGREVTRAGAKKLVLGHFYGRGPLRAVEDFVVGEAFRRLVHPHDRMEALFPRHPR